MLTQIADIPLVDLLAVILPCLTLFALVWWRQQQPNAANRQARDLRSWRGRFKYVGRLLGFAGLSCLVISMALMAHQNYRLASKYIQPAPSQVERPEGFPHRLINVEFSSQDGPTLRGWLIEPSQPATVILLHGYGSNRLSMLWHAEQLAEAGFGVLLYDERGSGESDGARRSYGWQDPVDVLAAVEYLHNRSSTANTQLGIAGCSIGGQIALQAAAQEQRLKAVWADGPSVVRAADLPEPHHGISLIAKISGHVFDWTLAARLQQLPPEPLIDRLPGLAGRPLQFVAGGTAANALGAEAQLVGKYVDQAGSTADLWIIGEAVHCDGPSVAPEIYSERFVKFFKQALLD